MPGGLDWLVGAAVDVGQGGPWAFYTGAALAGWLETKQGQACGGGGPEHFTPGATW